jgi:hypothetical protein
MNKKFEGINTARIRARRIKMEEEFCSTCTYKYLKVVEGKCPYRVNGLIRDGELVLICKSAVNNKGENICRKQ